MNNGQNQTKSRGSWSNIQKEKSGDMVNRRYKAKLCALCKFKYEGLLFS